MAKESSVSLQDLIDEENRTALASTDQSSASSPTTKRASQYVGNTLNVHSPNIRHSSIAGEGVGVTDLNQVRKKKLDPSDPSTWTRPHATSSNEHRPRATSEIQRASFETNEGDGASSTNSSPVNSKSRMLDFATPKAQPSTVSNDIPAPPTTHAQVTSTDETSATVAPVTSESTQGHNNLSAISSQGLGVKPDEDEANRRFSNQSASFSTVTDDSDRIGPITKDEDKNNEEAVEESSGESDRSSSDEDPSSPVSERGRKRKSNREPPSPESNKAPTLVAPEIKGIMSWQLMII